eukprot:scaffold94110_cov60-Phaeocystis_antarctica.AAC.2
MEKRCTDVAICEKTCDYCYCWVCDKPAKQCVTWKEHCICDGGPEWNLKRQKVLPRPSPRPSPPLSPPYLLSADALCARLCAAQAPSRGGAGAGAGPRDGPAAGHGRPRRDPPPVRERRGRPGRRRAALRCGGDAARGERAAGRGRGGRAGLRRVRADPP